MFTNGHVFPMVVIMEHILKKNIDIHMLFSYLNSENFRDSTPYKKVINNIYLEGTNLQAAVRALESRGTIRTLDVSKQ